MKNVHYFRIIILILVLIIFSFFTLICRVEEYGFESIDDEDIYTSYKIRMSSVPGQKTKIYPRVPFLYSKIILGDPFYAMFFVNGAFEKLLSVDAYYLINHKQIERLNLPKGSLESCRREVKGVVSEYAFDYQILKFKWDTLDSIQFHVHMSVIENGNEKQIILVNDLEKTKKSYFSNLIWEAMMGI